jgi:trehalose 6-phosphate synthase
MARALMKALTMPLAERRQRWNAMMARLEESSLATWFADFETALMDVGQGDRPVPLQVPAATGTASLLPTSLASLARH